MLTRKDNEALEDVAAFTDADDNKVLVLQHLELGIETSGMSSVPDSLQRIKY